MTTTDLTFEVQNLLGKTFGMTPEQITEESAEYGVTTLQIHFCELSGRYQGANAGDADQAKKFLAYQKDKRAAYRAARAAQKAAQS